MPNHSANFIPSSSCHGAADLPALHVDAYNAELRDSEGLVGDKASKRAFQAILDGWRERLRSLGDDPLGSKPTQDWSKKSLDKVLAEGDPRAAGLIHSAIEDFAQELANVIRCLLRLEAWHGTQRIAIGGGMRASRAGKLAVGRAAMLLKADGQGIDLQPICHHPDEAGLVGSVYLAPSQVLNGYDTMLAVDIGGSNIRAGIVELNQKKAADLSKARVEGLELWRHADDEPDREDAVGWLGDKLHELARRAKKQGLHLAPLVGIGCPGQIRSDGTIVKGGQNLPGGDWETEDFNLPARVREAVPEIGGNETVVLMHNDAVVQGLSQICHMRDIQRWGILTIGTGLGNARFTNRAERTS